MFHVVVAICIVSFITANPLVDEFTIFITHLSIQYCVLMNTIRTIDLLFVGHSIYLWVFSSLFSTFRQDS